MQNTGVQRATDWLPFVPGVEFKAEVQATTTYYDITERSVTMCDPGFMLYDWLEGILAICQMAPAPGDGLLSLGFPTSSAATEWLTSDVDIGPEISIMLTQL